MQKMMIYLSTLSHRLLSKGAYAAVLGAYSRLVRKNFAPVLLTPPKAKRILVLAPHMDDETIGCGGAIVAHVENGSTVDVVFTTEGELGFEEPLRSSSTVEQRRKIRRTESEKACAILGVSRSHCLGLPDGRTQATASSIAQLSNIIEEFKPELVYLPFISDAHHDHRITAEIFLSAVDRDSRLASLQCCCYEVWSPIYPNCIVDISDQMDTKMRALSCYESQLQMNNYLHSIRGLNAYRAINNKSEGYAEAFYLTSCADYQTLFNDFAASDQ